LPHLQQGADRALSMNERRKQKSERERDQWHNIN
jgi:hypothetical protein